MDANKSIPAHWSGVASSSSASCCLRLMRTTFFSDTAGTQSHRSGAVRTALTVRRGLAVPGPTPTGTLPDPGA
jgi:hypothetical protein